MALGKKPLVFLDIDGTLLDGKYQINDPRITEKIKEFQKKGYLFSLNSNRSLEDILSVASRFNIKGALIGENGLFYYSQKEDSLRWLLKDTELKKLLETKNGIEEVLQAVCEESFPELTFRFITTDTVQYLLEIDKKSVQKNCLIVLNNSYRKYTSSLHLYRSDGKGELLKLTAQEIEQIAVNMKKHIDDSVAEVVASKTFGNILMQSAKTDKKTALKELPDSIKERPPFSIGDELGDSMISGSAERFLCVANASKEVKAVSSFCSASQHAAGVIECLLEIDRRGPGTEAKPSSLQTVTGEEPSLGLKEAALTALKQKGFEAGHAGSSFVRFIDDQEKKWILKIGSTQQGADEIQNNVDGYRAMQEANLLGIIPENLYLVVAGDVSALILPDLGKSIAERSSAKKFDQEDIATLIDSFWELRDTTIRQSEKKQKDLNTRLLTENLYNLEGFPKELIDRYKNKIGKKDYTAKQPQIFDFTPDNLFLGTDGELTFIDPWPQNSYAGSFFISLGQFLTLASEVYRYEVFSKNKDLILNKLLKGIESEEDLRQAKDDYKKGEIMQYALSSMVRQESDPKRSKELADIAMNLINDIMEDR